MLLTSLASALALSLAPQASNPSFDCSRASTSTEHAICADPQLGQLDRRMAAAYASLRQRLPATAHAALTRDQRWFIGSRDEWQDNRTRSGFRDFSDLGERMRARVQMLDMMRTSPRPGFVGGWSNVAGTVQFSPAGDGQVFVDISTAQPTNARWLCEVAGRGRPSGGVLSFTTDDGWQLRFRVRGGYLQVEEIAPDGNAGARPHCGANGYVEGNYFSVDVK